jgi:hypothetical protein
MIPRVEAFLGENLPERSDPYQFFVLQQTNRQTREEMCVMAFIAGKARDVRNNHQIG